MAEAVATEAGKTEPDREFDVTAEMLVHDYDDERTIEEEENNEMGEILGNELDDLTQEAEIPVDQLFQMYLPQQDVSGGDISPPQDSNETDSSTDEILNSRNLTLDKEEIAQDLLPENTDDCAREESLDDLHSDLFAEPGSHASDSPGSYGTHRLLRSNTATDGDSESCSEDSDYVPLEEWKKTISVGLDYQAVIPVGLSHYGDAPAYDNEDRLLWDPSKLDVAPTEEYLVTVQRPPSGTMGVRSLPLGSHVRDDERALFILLQCGHSVVEALRRHRLQLAPILDEMSLWSEEECRNFESGLRTYGKNFHDIQQNKVRTRSVGELVQFYYLWKKTARHDSFANQARLTKKKYHLHPGITDYMDRFLEDAESLVSPVASQNLLDKHRINSKLPISILSSLNGPTPIGNNATLTGDLTVTSNMFSYTNGDVKPERTLKDPENCYPSVDIVTPVVLHTAPHHPISPTVRSIRGNMVHNTSLTSHTCNTSLTSHTCNTSTAVILNRRPLIGNMHTSNPITQ